MTTLKSSNPANDDDVKINKLVKKSISAESTGSSPTSGLNKSPGSLEAPKLPSMKLSDSSSDKISFKDQEDVLRTS